MGLPRGSLKVLCIINGRRRVLSYGSMGIVRISIVPALSSLIIWFRSGIWQKCPLVSDILADLYHPRLYW